MSRDWRLRVEDIIEATERALQFVGEMDAAAFDLPPLRDEMRTLLASDES